MAFASFDSKNSNTPMGEINMVPLIDVMLVLLVIFIVTAPLLTNSVKLALPRATTNPTENKPTTIEFSIDADGNLYWGHDQISREEAAERFKKASTEEPQPNVHLRADEIVEDCEDLRRALGLERWSLLGQSFGGFCVTRYLSEHAQSLEKVYITGGLPAVGHSIDEVYALSYEAMRLKSEEYYTRFPQDRDRMASLAEKAGRGELRTAGGDLVGPERLRSLGALLGGAGGADTIHYLLERGPDSWAFRYDLGQCLPFGGRFPLYAVIHESCWADAGTTDWAAQRVRPAVFDDDPTLLTGEHVRREAFVEDAGLRPWLEVADLLAAQEGPALYDPARLKATPWLFFAALTVVQNVFVGPWTVLPAYLPIVLGAAVLQPPLREAAQLGIDDEPSAPPRDALSSPATAPAQQE